MRGGSLGERSPRLLFVYGTLRPCAGTAMARWLAEAGLHVGSGSVRGRLYDLGPYPAFVDAGARVEWVRGDVYRLPRLEPLLRVLDRYESHAYARVRRPVRLDALGPRRRDAWIYLYLGPLLGVPRIASGEYGRRARGP